MKKYIKPETEIITVNYESICAGGFGVNNSNPANGDEAGAREGGHFSLIDWDDISSSMCTSRNAWNTWDDE